MQPLVTAFQSKCDKVSIFGAVDFFFWTTQPNLIIRMIRAWSQER